MEQDPNNTQQEQQHFDADSEAEAMFARWQQATPAAEEKTIEEKPVEQTQEKPSVEEKSVEKAVEKPVAKEEEDLPPGPKTESSKNAWTALKQELKELKESKLPATERLAQEREIALQEAQKKLAEFEGKDISQYEKKIAELEAKYTEAEKFRAIHDVQNSETYRNEILTPAAEIGEQMDVLAKMYDIDANDLKSALQIEDVAEQRKKINELTDGWNQLDAVDLLSAARQTRQLLAKSQQLLDSAEKTKGELKFIEEQEGKKKAETEAASIKAAVEAIDRNIWEKMPRFKDDAEIKEAVAKAEIKKDPTSLALGAKAAAMLPYLLKNLDAREARIKELEDNLAKRVAASPKPTSIASPEKQDKSDGPIDFSPEGIMARWNAARAA